MKEYILLLCSAVFLLASLHTASAACRDLGKCCPGKNVTCRSEVTEDEAILKGKKYCYCDEYCSGVGDCCNDYQRYCRAVDCAVGSWEQWGECSKDCGFGERKRDRMVARKPENGGIKCPIMQQRRWCMGHACQRRRHGEAAIRETAKIIRAQFGSLRQNKLYNPWIGIRKNLFYHYKADEVIDRPGYCAEFEIVRSRKTCGDRNSHLAKGQRVCVECQPLAMRHDLGVRCLGHGVFEEKTQWNAVSEYGCHGTWVMKTKHKECSCKPDKKSSFIFV